MNKMRYFRKRLNRGIVLGVLLLVAVILFTVISDARFDRVEKDRIKSLTNSYISDYTALLTDHLAKPLGTVPTEEDGERIASDFAEFADKYFIYKKDPSAMGGNGNSKNIEEIKAEYRGSVTAHLGRCRLYSMSLSAEGPWEGVRVKKAGPRNAIVSVDLSGKIRLSGDPSELYFPGMYAYANVIGEFMIDEYGNLVPVTPPAPDDTVVDGSCTVTASLFFEKVNGEWKIAYVTYAYLNVDASSIERGEYSK